METIDGAECRVYKTSIMQKAGDLLVTLLFLTAFQSLVFLFTHSYGYLAVTGFVLIGAGFVCRKFGISSYWVIRLNDDGIQMGGPILPCIIAYEDISLLTLGALGETVAGISALSPLTIVAGTRKVKIRLKQRDAGPCLNTIRERAPYAGGVDYSNVKGGGRLSKKIENIIEFKPEIESEKYSEALAVHAWSLIAPGVLLLIPLVIVLFYDHSAEHGFSLYAGVGVSFASGCGLIAKGLSMRQKSRPGKASSGK